MTPRLQPGQTVAARGRSWRLRSAMAYGDCVALDLEAADAVPAERRILLQPFDDVRPVGAARPLVVSRQAWWAALGARLLSLLAPDGLVAPAAARLDLLPYQLEPAIAVASGGAVRVLLADAVGLGKTVQAGIIIAELFARRAAGRVLVLVPASLRDQWARELRSRFCLDADVVDAAALRAIAVSLPRTVNPWAVPRVAVVSIDFAKRPEVRLGLHEAGWDLVVIDEAHLVASDSERYRAADQLCRQAGRVVLVTATPHGGLDTAFAGLARLGASNESEPLLMFRRCRRDVGLDSARRVRLLRVRLGAAELDTLRTLVAYLRRVWLAQASAPADTGARLAAIFLLKRALSSPAALLRSVQRRRALLASAAAPLPRQLPLPLDDDLDPADEEPCDALGASGLDDGGEELAWLDRVAAAAERAVLDHRKLRALSRLARRCGEPMIVFTEYRDTLQELEARLGRLRRCVSLHGGLGREQRDAVLSAFAEGRADILLATDVAATGLNLHDRCRLVVTLELPWSPTRLEQRFGRVDRIGQTRTVHALCLVGRSTPEERILARLAFRAERARRTLGDTDTETWPRLTDAEAAELLLGHASLAALLAGSPRPAAAAPPRPGTVAGPVERPCLVNEGQAEACRLQRHRLIRDALGRRTHAAPARVAASPPAPIVSFVRARPDRAMVYAGNASLGRARPGVLAVFEASTIDARGRLLSEALVPIRLFCRVRRPASRQDARTIAGLLPTTLRPAVAPQLAGAVRGLVQRTSALVEASVAPQRTRALHRERTGHTDTSVPVQRGLFERRAERNADTASEACRRRAPAQPGRNPRTSRPSGVSAVPPRLRFVLVVTA